MHFFLSEIARRTVNKFRYYFGNVGKEDDQGPGTSFVNSLVYMRKIKIT